jgi:hypothetical protein
VIITLAIQRFQAILQCAELLADTGIIAGKAVEVLEDGLRSQRIMAALAGGKVFEVIEPVLAEVLNGNLIYEELFMSGFGFVLLMQASAEVLEDVAFIPFEMHEKEFVRSAQPMLESIHAGSGLSLICFRSSGMFGHFEAMSDERKKPK